jgi:hypothetical protein
MAPYDAIDKRNADDERIAFARTLLDAAVDIMSMHNQLLCTDVIRGILSYKQRPGDHQTSQ